MSNDNKNINPHDSIDDILEEYRKLQKKTARHSGDNNDFKAHTNNGGSQNISTALSAQSKKQPRSNKKGKTLENELRKTQKKKNARKNAVAASQKLHNFFHSKIGKSLIIAFCAVFAVSCAAGGAVYLHQKNKNAYLKKYEQKYGITYPVGILPEYCDEYAAVKSMVGYMFIDDDINTAVTSNVTDGTYIDPNCRVDGFGPNTIIYLSSQSVPSLESAYSSAASFNSSSRYIAYGSLYEKHKWRIVGAFYTNTNPDDDNGYIFPYNEAGKMTAKSFSVYASELSARFIYSTGYTITRGDKLLTISVDSNTYNGLRFVITAVMADSKDKEFDAKSKSNIRYPQAVYNTIGKDNPYKNTEKWYPEIENPDDKNSTIKQTIDDYIR